MQPYIYWSKNHPDLETYAHSYDRTIYTVEWKTY